MLFALSESWKGDIPNVPQKVDCLFVVGENTMDTDVALPGW